MTTAHRPTWYTAIGGERQGGNANVSKTIKVCSRDLPGHTKMKYRDLDEYTDDKNKLRENLQTLERGGKSGKVLALENIKKVTQQEYVNPFPEDCDHFIGSDMNPPRQRKRLKRQSDRNGKMNRRKKKRREESEVDRGRVQNEGRESESDGEITDEGELSSSSKESETDEEELELMKELENLKREKKEKLQREKEEQIKMKQMCNNVLTNNPLINLVDSDKEEDFTHKKKWTEDIIFRNTQAKKGTGTGTETGPGAEPEFINDTVRNAFHKKFIMKYIH